MSRAKKTGHFNLLTTWITHLNRPFVWPQADSLQSSSRPPSSKAVRKHHFVIPVPIALKPLFWIVFLFHPQKLREFRIAAFHLLSSRVSMIGQVGRTSPPGGHVDQPPETVSRALHALRIVHRVQVENRASISLLCPRQETLIVAFDQS